MAQMPASINPSWQHHHTCILSLFSENEERVYYGMENLLYTIPLLLLSCTNWRNWRTQPPPFPMFLVCSLLAGQTAKTDISTRWSLSLNEAQQVKYLQPAREGKIGETHLTAFNSYLQPLEKSAMLFM